MRSFDHWILCANFHGPFYCLIAGYHQKKAASMQKSAPFPRAKSVPKNAEKR